MVVAICDDDPVWAAKEEEMLAAYVQNNYLDIEIKSFRTREALLAYEEKAPQAVFLDIELDQDSGILVAQEINKKWKNCQIIYVTNHLFYATDVYNTDHSFFLLKDQFEEKIADVFYKLLHILHQQSERLVFSVIGSSDIVLNPDSIIYFERDQRITNIVTREGTYMVWDKLDEIEQRLSPLDFARCHNSYIVYFPAVREVQKNAFTMKNGHKVVISRSYARKVKHLFMNWAVTQIS